MTLNRTKLRVAAGMLVLLMGAPTFAQDIEGAQPWAPAEVSPYGLGPRPNEGYFARVHELYWSIGRPRTTLVGSNLTRQVDFGELIFFPNPNPPPAAFLGLATRDQTSTLDTSNFTSPFVSGQRVEFGRIVDHSGWLFSTFRTDVQNQCIFGVNVDMTFADPLNLLEGNIVPDPVIAGRNILGQLPVTFLNLEVHNKAMSWGAELMGLHRTAELHDGGFLEWSAGARYFEFDEDFTVFGQGGFTSFSGITDDGAGNSFWVNRAENHILGPQVALRWFKIFSRISASAEGRLMFGTNFQNVRQQSTIGNNLQNVLGTLGYPDAWAGSSASHEFHAMEWAPLVELRAEVNYQVTRNINFHCGWTGMWADGIARASHMINYQLPDLGIAGNLNRESLLIHGLSMGVDFNR